MQERPREIYLGDWLSGLKPPRIVQQYIKFTARKGKTECYNFLATCAKNDNDRQCKCYIKKRVVLFVTLIGRTPKKVPT